MEYTEAELLEKKQEIEEAQSQIAELTGEQNVLLRTLKDEFGCDSIDSAEEKLTKFKKEGEKISTKIEKLSEQLKSKFE